MVAANEPRGRRQYRPPFRPGSGRIISAADVEHQLQRATTRAEEQHAAAVDQKRAQVAKAEQVRRSAAEFARSAAHDATVATEDLVRFDDLATRLSSAEEAYEAAVRADAESARSLAAHCLSWTGSWGNATAPALHSNRRATPGIAEGFPKLSSSRP